MAATSSGVVDSVFVYGLLKRGFSLHHHMAQGIFVGNASVQGVLCSIGQYPGLVEGSGVVHGEVYRFADIAVALEVLDEVEEYDPLDIERSEFIRRVCSTTLDADKSIVQAWCYTYNRDVSGLSRLKAGVWEEPTQ